VHPGAENAVLAGNATIALEIIDEMPDIDCIVAPYGSGALVTGIACGVRAILREKNVDEKKIRVVAVEPETASPFSLSMKNGKATKFENYQSSFVDGCGGKAVLPKIWNLARDHVDDGVSVPLERIKEAICILLERNHIVAEGAGACTVAAAMSGRCPGKNIVCVVSGGGLDTEHLIDFLQKSNNNVVMKKNTSVWNGDFVIASLLASAAACCCYYYFYHQKT